jgi:hypothetical protein
MVPKNNAEYRKYFAGIVPDATPDPNVIEDSQMRLRDGVPPPWAVSLELFLPPYILP